jgi:hypothetical protein
VPELTNTIIRDLPRLRDTEAISRDTTTRSVPLRGPNRPMTIKSLQSILAHPVFWNSTLLLLEDFDIIKSTYPEKDQNCLKSPLSLLITLLEGLKGTGR